MPEEHIYIIISQTGTLLSRILKKITGAEYNHASISLYEDLHIMYSFGRRNPYNPFWGGFVMESPCTGTFKRFSQTRAVVLEITVSRELHDTICRRIEKMFSRRQEYHYNYLGLFLAALHIRYCCKNHYYCSEFVKEILLRHRIIEEGMLSPIVQPIHFLQIPEARMVYSGLLCEYGVEI